MVDAKDAMDKQAVFDYCVKEVKEKSSACDFSVRGSQFRRPLLEFSGSCAGCAETSYARLITKMFVYRSFISNATGCSSIWGGPAATSPYTVNHCGKGPAWSNSLFEDNAEHGFGMLLGYEAVRSKLIDNVKALSDMKISDELTSAADAWLEVKDDPEADLREGSALRALLRKASSWNNDEAKALADEIMEKRDYMDKKSFWVFGGDGWAYDIGFGGLDHVLASGMDINVFVFDTEVYSNTGGQASKASNIGQVAQFAAAGKSIKKKSLAEIAMSYGYVYVAQVAMGAKPAQTIKAIEEAEKYHGPSLIIGYSPCEMHSIAGGMMHCQDEMKRAVECGYWNLFRFNPDAEKGKKFTLDSKEPAGGYREFLMNEARYSRLTREFPERAEDLFAKSEEYAKERYDYLVKLKEMYAEL